MSDKRKRMVSCVLWVKFNVVVEGARGLGPLPSPGWLRHCCVCIQSADCKRRTGVGSVTEMAWLLKGQLTVLSRRCNMVYHGLLLHHRATHESTLRTWALFTTTTKRGERIAFNSLTTYASMDKIWLWCQHHWPPTWPPRLHGNKSSAATLGADWRCATAITSASLNFPSPSPSTDFLFSSFKLFLIVGL